jgi:nicotinamidase-related amidase
VADAQPDIKRTGVGRVPERGEKIKALAAWRRSGRAVIHVRHESVEPGSTYRPGQPGCEFKPCAAPLAGERVVVKHVNSAFIGTGLAETLRAACAAPPKSTPCPSPTSRANTAAS